MLIDIINNKVKPEYEINEYQKPKLEVIVDNTKKEK